MNRYNHFLFSFLALLLLGCGEKKGGSIQVENYTIGKTGEVMLIMDDVYWNDSLRSIVTRALTHSQTGLNQPEPLFDLLQLQNDDFTSYFQRHRNIVRFDLHPDYSGNRFNLEEDPFASPQIYAHFKGNHADSLLALFKKYEKEIIQNLYNNDLKRTQLAHNMDRNDELAQCIRERFGITLSIPDQYHVARLEDDFLWLLNRTAQNDRCILIYKTAAHELSPDMVMDIRDSITRKYIPGAEIGAYPIIARRAGYPIIAEYAVGNRYGVEMRGLWESVNDKMGGPFYNFTFNDEETGNLICVDGFVYAPHEKKRDYLREVEAVVKSIQ